MATPKKKSPATPAPTPPAKAANGKGLPKTQAKQQQTTRLWLMFPPKLITVPVIWELGKKHKVITNVRQASVNDEIGIVCLELDGTREAIKGAIKWMESIGVSVEPVEINVIES